jgi:Cell division initiation protein
MHNMDVTPRELRDIDIRERLGGYNKDDVDDLLERAAARIEGLEGQLRAAQSQVEAGAADTSKTRDTEDMLHRTLLLAQRAADEAVAEAQAKARQILDDAENKSRSMVSEAETNARRQAETERRRLEGEVLDFGAKRDALVADVDALERFETDYRGRLRRAVEADLEMLSAKGSVAPSPRPTTHDVEMPAASAPNITTEVTVAAPAPVVSTSAPAPAPAPVASTPAPVPPPAFGVAASGAPPVAPVPVESATVVPDASASPEPSPPATAAPPWEEVSTPPVTRPPLFDAEPESEHLDDDAFFASLREAVTDETPLGPRDTPSAGANVFDQDDRGGGLFRRRGR